ncbi:unnamed protein product [Lactuca saligna]|uniref:FH2 domain-containing protein n=1 Tax=Lactuca saligna TaxID=75948 RepID=A0AA35Z3K9_LACSI|nr:unnamed protein product [Lactuca saligna]
MSEQHFWMIYFILLLPRLKDDDYMLLSTLEIVQIHEGLLQKLRNKNNTSMELTEDTNGNTSLSEKGSEVLADKLPEVLDFSKDLQSLESAAKMQLKYLAEEMEAITKGLEKVVQELSTLMMH